MKTMNPTTLPVSGVVLGASLLPMSQAVAEEVSVSANIGVVSNYMWRGLSQTNDGAAVQGGLDLSMGGFYAGTWASNVDFGDDDVADNQTEVDVYLGYDFSLTMEEASLGVNAIYYAYPDDSTLDFAEIGVSGGYGVVSAGIQYTFWTDAGGDDAHLYYSLGLDFALPQDFSMSPYFGYYDFDGWSDSDCFHYGLGISKDAGDFGSFGINVDKIDPKTDASYSDSQKKTKFWVSWSKEF